MTNTYKKIKHKHLPQSENLNFSFTGRLGKWCDLAFNIAIASRILSLCPREGSSVTSIYTPRAIKWQKRQQKSSQVYVCQHFLPPPRCPPPTQDHLVTTLGAYCLPFATVWKTWRVIAFKRLLFLKGYYCWLAKNLPWASPDLCPKGIFINTKIQSVIRPMFWDIHISTLQSATWLCVLFRSLWTGLSVSFPMRLALCSVFPSPILQTYAREVPVMDVCREDPRILSSGPFPVLPKLPVDGSATVMSCCIHRWANGSLPFYVSGAVPQPLTEHHIYPTVPESSFHQLPHQILSAVSVCLHWTLI